MLFLMSPAKKLAPAPAALEMTTPRCLAQAIELAKVAKKLSIDNLMTTMELSPKLAKLNYERWQAFDADNVDAWTPAISTFSGESYQELTLQAFSLEQWQYLNRRLRILSGLYGLLRPLDGILPHRLEMTANFRQPQAASLYEVWERPIASLINEDLEQLDPDDDRLVVSLASAGYEKAVHAASLSAPILRLRFVKIRKGVQGSLGHAEKRARGAFAQYAIRQQITKKEQILQYNDNGFIFNPELSDDKVLFFSQDQS